MVTRALVPPTFVVGVLCSVFCFGAGCSAPGPRRPGPRPAPQADGPAPDAAGIGIPAIEAAAPPDVAADKLVLADAAGAPDAPVLADAPAAPDAGAPPDAGGGGDGGAGDPGGDPVPGKPWLRLCPRAWDQRQCCQFLCSCLERLCDDSPMDKARFAGCMSMCTKLTDFRARCQVYHCFESKNPGATRDHVSHCGHASGRVGGGSCSIIQQQGQ